MSPIDAYLDDLRTALPALPILRRRIVAEIRDHLLTVAAEEEESGASRAVAEQRAVERTGPPRPLAAEFVALEARRGMMTANRAAPATLAVWLGVLLTNVLSSQFLPQWRAMHNTHLVWMWRGTPETLHQLWVPSLAVAGALLACVAFADRSRLRSGAGLLTTIGLGAIVAGWTGWWWSSTSLLTYESLLAIGLVGAIVLSASRTRRETVNRWSALVMLFALLALSLSTVIQLLGGLASVPLNLWSTPLTVVMWLIVPLTLSALAGVTRAVVASWSP
jgi:hypothetical protein